MKKGLIFYPHDFLQNNSGTHQRVLQLIKYFQSRQINLDLLTFKNDNQKAYHHYFSHLYFVKKEKSLYDSAIHHIKKRYGTLDNAVTSKLRRLFRQIINNNDYDFIIINYVYWGLLVKELKNKTTKTFIDLHDFITLNSFQQHKNFFHLGHYFYEEIKRIRNFHYALSISEEEQTFLQPFCPNTNFIHIPAFFEKNFLTSDNIKYELLFIGSDNIFNIEGINWFIEKVFPFLNKSIRLLIVGSVIKHIPREHNHIKKILFLKNIKEAYEQSQLSICPLLGGTGLKIKVIESLSFGRPVITTPHGLTGISQKANNGCILANNEKAFVKKINHLLFNNQSFSTLTKQAKLFFEKHFCKNSIYEKLDNFFC